MAEEVADKATAKPEVNEVAKALEEVRLQNGGKLRPPDVIKAAEPEASPLHKHFTWDDGEAAHQYRLYEARHLIRTVTVIREERVMPLYINVPSIPVSESGYLPVDLIVNKPDELKLAIGIAIERLKASSRSVEDLRHILSRTGSEHLATLEIAEGGLETATGAIKKIQGSRN